MEPGALHAAKHHAHRPVLDAVVQFLDRRVDREERRHDDPPHPAVGPGPDVGHEAVVGPAHAELDLRVAGQVDDEERGVDNLDVDAHLVGGVKPVGDVLERLAAPERVGEVLGARGGRLRVVSAEPGRLRDQPRADDPPVAEPPRGRLRRADEHGLEVAVLLVEELPHRLRLDYVRVSVDYYRHNPPRVCGYEVPTVGRGAL